MSVVILSTTAVEGSPYFVRVAFATEDGSAVTPNSAAYWLTDGSGNVINSLSSVAMSGLATSVDILLTSTDLRVVATDIIDLSDKLTQSTTRYLTVMYTYDSQLASGLTAYTQAAFTLADLIVVT